MLRERNGPLTTRNPLLYLAVGMDEQNFISPKEAAGILRISAKFFYDLMSGRRCDNPPKVIKLGRHLRLPRAEFFRWVDSQARKPPKRKR